MQPISLSVGPLAAADADGIAKSQTVSGAANVVLDGALASGGVVVLDTPRRVLITNGGNDVGVNFTVYGTWFNGQSISETLAGTNGSTVATTLDFATVTRVATSASTSASGITVGTNGVAGSKWVRLDDFAPATWSFQASVSGTVNYTVQTTMDDPNDPFNAVAIGSVNWVSSSDSNLVGATGTKYGVFTGAPVFVRMLLNSGSGSVSGKLLQSSAVPA